MPFLNVDAAEGVEHIPLKINNQTVIHARSKNQLFRITGGGFRIWKWETGGTVVALLQNEAKWSYLYFSLDVSTGNKLLRAGITAHAVRGLCRRNHVKLDEAWDP